MGNKKFRRKINIFKGVAVLAILLSAVLGVSACTWFESDASAANSEYDANGNLRVSAANVLLNRAQSNGLVNENTGSFEWQLNYYINSSDASLVDSKYDQTNYDLLYNKLKDVSNPNDIVKDNEDDDLTVEKGIVSLKNVIYSEDKTDAQIALIAQMMGMQSSGTDLYLSNIGSFVYNSRIIYFCFPTYSVSISGITYQIKLSVDYSKLKIVMGKNGLFELVGDASDAFSTAYRVGTSGEWQTDYNMAEVYESHDDNNAGSKFFIRFNPILQKGSTNRYLRVQTLAQSYSKGSNVEILSGNSNRGNSVYTSPLTFNVYKQTFKISCNNSSTMDYEGLDYDTQKYYFSTKEKSLKNSDTSVQRFSSLTGYFVEGRVVSVSRYINKKGNYAFQSWTVNGKSDNTIALKNDNNVIDGLIPNEMFSESAKACLDGYSMSVGVDAVAVQNSESEKIPTLYISKQSSSNAPYAEVFSVSNNETTGKLYVVSGQDTASGVFYSNLVKVRNFALSGTFYDGDNFQTSGSDAILNDVDIYIWQDSTLLAKYNQLGGLIWIANNDVKNAYLLSMGLSNDNDLACSIKNSQFTVGNLGYNCHLTFEKQIDQATTASYSFYSTAMVNSEIAGKYILSPQKETNTYSDRIGNTIIGTKLVADNKVEVNIYAKNDNENTIYPLGSNVSTANSFNGVQYQVISTTTTETDAYGYTTSRVIISLLLPSNCSLTAYNVESINSICNVVYTLDEDKDEKNLNELSKFILCDVGYNEENRSTTRTFYYVETESLNSGDISDGSTLNCLMYNSNFYQYTHRDNGKYYYEYAFDDGNNVYRYIIERTDGTDGNDDTYAHYKYKLLKDDEWSTDTPISEEDDKVKVSYAIKYGGKDYVYNQQSSQSAVSVIASAFKTDLVIKIENNGGLQSTTINKSGELSVSDFTSEFLTNLYVYYNIVDYVFNNSGSNTTEHFYTAPLGMKTLKIDKTDSTSGTTISTSYSIKWFQDELSSLSYNSQLVYDSALGQTNESALIMLGADILSGNCPTNFYKATDFGKSIIADHYYYIAPLGESTTLYVSQYRSTDQDYVSSTETLLVSLTKNENGKYVLVDDALIEYDNTEHAGQQRYNYTIYSADYISKVTEYMHALTSSSLQNSSTYISLSDNHNGTFTSIVKAQEKTVKTSMAAKNTLYDSNGNLVSLSSLDSIDNSSFIGQEASRNFVANANVGAIVIDGETRYYFSSAKKYTLNCIGLSDTGSPSKQVNSEYKFYTYSSQTNKVFENTLYFDGTNYYISTGKTVSDGTISGTELKKLDNWGDYYFDEDTGIRYVTSDGKIYDGNYIIDGKEYYNTCVYSYYIENTQYFNAFVELDGDNRVITTYKVQGLSLSSDIGKIEYLAKDNNGQFVIVNDTVCEYNDAEHQGQQRYIKLYQIVRTVEIPAPTNVIYREAKTVDDEQVHLLGKVILLGNAEFEIYPSFNYYLENDDDEILRVNNGEVSYYSIDYTTTTGVVQGFPGVKILSGAPYVNPIMYFEVKHKAEERAVVDIALEFTNGYYVEVLANAISSSQNNLIYDFSTISFKDTITNLTSNDYINRLYYVLEKSTQNSIVAYVKNNGEYSLYIGNNPLTIQNVGINDGDPYVYSILTIDSSGKYFDKLYFINKNGDYEELKYDNLIIWESSATALEDIPSFDAHSYYISDNGLIILSSDAIENQLCTKLDNLFASGTGSVASDYDCSNLLIGGQTSAYRVNKSAIDLTSGLQSFWWEDAINISNNYNSSDPYFLTGKEGVVLVASPIVTINNDGENIIYRFKRWTIYSRYNSEILYLNSEFDNHADIYNAVMRFSSDNAGYYIFMPVYERVYTLNIGTTTTDDDINIGGSVSVSYSGTAIDMSEDRSQYGDNAKNIYFVEMLKTLNNGQSQYYYSNFEITPLLYYTGKTQEINNQDGTTITYPVFESRGDILKITYTSTLNSTDLYLVPIYDNDGNYSNYTVMILSDCPTLSDSPCLIKVTANNGYYKFSYKLDGKTISATYKYSQYINGYQKGVDPSTQTTNELLDPTVENLLSHAYSVNYYYDALYEQQSGQSNSSKVVLYYSTEYFKNGDNKMYAINSDDVLALFEIADEQATPATLIEKDEFINRILNKGEAFANVVTKKFSSLATETGNSLNLSAKDSAPDDFASGSDVFFKSKLAYLASGELYSYIENDQEVINATQQFKTSYFERDTKIIISATADSGYRLKDWYLAEYNSNTGSWVKSSTSLSNSVGDAYYDIIREVYYNESNSTWYWKTDYFSTSNVGDITYYTYYQDKSKSTVATVPNNMLDDVRGYYGQAIIGGQTRYIPVYRKNDTSSEWFTDANFSEAYVGEVSVKSHYECIEKNPDDSYSIGNTIVWKHDGNFYRTKETGNIVIKGNNVYIYNLHSNIRVIAEFVEVYQAYIFADSNNLDQTDVEVVAAYYSVENDGIRSDISGTNLTSLRDKEVQKIDTKDFSYNRYNTAENTKTTKTTIDKDNYVGYQNYTTLTSNSSGINYKIVEDKLEFNNMRFDEGTSLYLIVKVYYNTALSVHSLGMNSQYSLTPVMQPTATYITSNSSNETYDEHYFYIFKVTFNRDLSYHYFDGTSNKIYFDSENKTSLQTTLLANNLSSTVGAGNYNPEYVIHPQRKQSLVSDVLSGNYTKYYSNLFDFYDKNGNNAEFEFNNDKVRLNKSSNFYNNFISTLNNAGIDTSNTQFGTIINTWYFSMKELFSVLRNEYKVVIGFDHVTQKGETAGLKTVDEIFGVIKLKFKTTDAENLGDIKNVITAPITTGSTNYINLSCVPIYTYTTSIKVISEINDNGTISFDENQKDYFFDTLGIKLIQSVYTSGGYSGYTYIGLGDKKTGKTLTLNGVKEDYPTNYTYSVNTSADNMFAQDYALAANTKMVLGGIGEFDENSEKSTYEYLKSTNGVYYIEYEKDGTTYQYIFAGWYEQKKNTDGTWGELQLMSNDLTEPYMSPANADTNIIALFERAVTVIISGAKNSFDVNFNSQTDSLGNAIVAKSDGDICTYSGTFGLSTCLDLDITPSGGYRIGETWNIGRENGNSLSYSLKDSAISRLLKYRQISGSEYADYADFEYLNLAKSANISFVVGEIIKATIEQGASSTKTSQLCIDLSMKSVQLTYIIIKGYLTFDGDTNTSNHSGLDVQIYKEIGGNQWKEILRTEYQDGKVKNVAEYAEKDCAQRDIQIELENNDLKIYGYFDAEDYNGKLAVAYYTSDEEAETVPTLKAWYVNEFGENTNSIESGKHFNFYINSQVFHKICYYYTGAASGSSNLNSTSGKTENEIADLENKYNTNFGLNNDSISYVLSATIEAKSAVKVSYATIDSLKNLDNTVSIENNSNITKVSKSGGSITYVGGYFDDEDIVHENGTLSFDTSANTSCYNFYSNTKITLNNSTIIYANDDNYYSFIGWFEYDATEHKLNAKSNTTTFVSSSAGGHYVAVFAKVAFIDDAYTKTISTGEQDKNGSIEILSKNKTLNGLDFATYGTDTFSIYDNETGTHKDTQKIFALVGGEITIKVVADQNYLISAVEVWNTEQVKNAGALPIKTISGEDQDTLTTNYQIENNTNLTIIGQLSRGYSVVVEQLYFDSIAMNNIGVLYTGKDISSYLYKGESKLDYKDYYCFASGATLSIKFNSINCYGLISFYINGTKLDVDSINENTYFSKTFEISEDVVIEVRFTQFVKVVASSYDTTGTKIDKNISLSYVDQYDKTKTITIQKDTEQKVLSGTILSLKVSNDDANLFSKWQWRYKNASDEPSTISTSSQCEFEVQYSYTYGKFSKEIVNVEIQAIFYSTITVTIEKVIDSLHVSDNSLYNSSSKTYDSIIWANLDVSVKYTDPNGTEKTTDLGSLKEKEFSIQTGTGVTVEVKINKSRETKYNYQIKYYPNDNSSDSQTISNKTSTVFSKDSTIEIHFYAKLNITLNRLVNNKLTASSGDILYVAYAIGDITSTKITIDNNAATKTTSNAGNSSSTVISIAKPQEGYLFAGFTINGTNVGYNEHTDEGYYYFNVKYTSDQNQNGKIEDNTYYTSSTDINISACWYEATNLSFTVMLDGIDILGNDDLSNKLYMNIIGNMLTPNGNVYKTTLQSLLINYDNKNTLQALTNSTLGLIASTYSGYQFVGFFYSVDGGDTYTKLCHTNEASSETQNQYLGKISYGDILASLLTLESTDKSYTIKAEYVSAWQISSLLTIVNTSGSQFENELNESTIEYVQVYKDGESWKQISDKNVFGGTNTTFETNYFFPYYSNYIAIHTDTKYDSNKISSIGYFVNGKQVTTVGTVSFKDGDKTKEFIIIDLSQDNAGLSTIGDETKKLECKQNNLIVEQRFVKNVDYVVRVGVNGTNDISQVGNINFDNLKITISYKKYADESPTEITYKENGDNTYWNKSNNSLYIKLSLPIGTKISTKIYKADETTPTLTTTDSSTYYLNGWYLYAGYNIASSTSVINYSNQVDFVLTDDIDIVAQFKKDEIDRSTITQWSYLFNGEAFDGSYKYSSTLQGEQTDNSGIASKLTEYLLNLNYDATDNKTRTFVGPNGETLAISYDSGVYTISRTKDGTTITKQFMFMGWYQEIKDAQTDSTYLFVTDKLGLNYYTADDPMPAQMTKASNMVAVFTQIITNTFDLSNALLYTNLKQNLNKFAFGLLENNSALSTCLDADGKLVWKTLYNSNLSFDYYTALGYHFNGSGDKNSINKEKDSTTKQNINKATTYDNFITSAITSDLNGIDGISNETLVKSVYKYTVNSTDNKIISISSVLNCSTHDHSADDGTAQEPDAESAAANLSDFEKTAATGKNSMLKTRLLAARESAETTATAMSDMFEIDNNNSLEVKIGTKINGLVNDDLASSIICILTIKLPDGTIETKSLSVTELTKYDDILPIGTTISISITNKTSVKVLSSIKVYLVSENNWNTSGAIFQELVMGSNAGESSLFIVSTDESVLDGQQGMQYLLFEINYANIYNVELEENDINKGSASVTYIDGSEDCSYDVEISSKDNYAFDNLTVKFDADETIKISIKEVIAAAVGYTGQLGSTNLKDLLSALQTGETAAGNWKVIKSINGDEVTYTLKYSTLVSISFSTSYSATDTLNCSYINKFTGKFTIDTNVKISAEYLHVATVLASYSKEDFDANKENYISTTTTDAGLLFVYDYQFFKETTEKYIIINKLDSLFSVKLSSEDYILVGYYYSGKTLKNNSADTTNETLVIENSLGEASNIVVIEAIYVGTISTKVKCEFDWFSYDNSSVEILGTPKNDISLFVNGEKQEAGADGWTIKTPLHKTSNIFASSQNDYFSFINWRVKYKEKWLAQEVNTSDTTEYKAYTIDSSALNVGTNLMQTLINQLINSKDFEGLTGSTTFYKYTETETIDISQFVVYAYLEEEVVEICINYSDLGEKFTIKFGEQSEEAGREQYSLSDNGNTILFKQFDEKETSSTTDNKVLKIAYGKHLSQNDLSITIVANEYKSRNSASIARSLYNNVPIREIGNGKYSERKYLELNGFRDSLGNVQVEEIDGLKNAITISTSAYKHSSQWTIDTTSLYLVEMTYATNQTMNESKNVTISATLNGASESVDAKTNFTFSDSEGNTTYAALSLLIRDGDNVKISVENAGDMISLFKGLAISDANLLTISDIFDEFVGAGISELSNTDLKSWKTILEVDENGQQIYYTNLNQYSKNNISQSATEYEFIATQNISFVADYLGLFNTQRQYITTLIGAEDSICYEHSSDGQTTYTGNNFVIVITQAGADIVFKRKDKNYNNQDYNHTQTGTIVKSSSTGSLSAEQLSALGFDSNYDYNEKSNNIYIKSSTEQISIGIKSTKYVTAEISVLYKHLSANSSLIRTLSESADDIYVYNWLNPNVSNKAYILMFENDDKLKEKLSNLADEDKSINKTEVSVGTKIALVSEALDGYNFVGFKLVSQTCEKTLKDYSVQHTIDNSQIYEARNVVNKYTTLVVNGKTYYYCAIAGKGLSGNIEVVALYEPKMYILNISHKTFDEDTVIQSLQRGESFKPDEDKDESTIYGKISSTSLLISSDDIVELKISTLGFAEYKGIASSDDRTYLSLYSTNARIEAFSESDAAQALKDNPTQYYGKKLYEKDDPLFFFGSEKTDSDDGVTFGTINNDTLFTSDYTTLADNGEFVQNTYSTSYLYLMFGDVESDVNLSAYFTSLYYDIDIIFGEIESTIKEATNTSNSSSLDNSNLANYNYVAYSLKYQQYIKETSGKWTNPSADSITGYNFGIAEGDPYIYTFVDNKGNQLAYPVRVAISMLSSAGIDKNDEEENLTLKGGQSIYVNKANQKVKRTFGDNDQLVASTAYSSTQLSNIYNYIYKDGDNYNLAEGLFKLQIGEQSCDSSELNLDGATIETDDNFEYVILKNINVGDAAIVNITINFADSTKPNITINVKVFADENAGFPLVQIAQSEKANQEIFGLNTISIQTKNFENSYDYGFSQTFFSDAFVSKDGNIELDREKYPDGLHLDVALTYQIFGKEIQATVNFGSLGMQYANMKQGNDYTDGIVNLMNDSDIEKLNAINYGYHTYTDHEHNENGYSYCEECNQCTNCINGEHNCSMIDKYFIYIIKNSNMYVDALLNGVVNKQITQSDYAKFLSELLSFNPFGSLSAEEASDKGNYNGNTTGSVFDYIDFSKEKLQSLLIKSGYTELANRLNNNSCSDLSFKQLDIYSNFTNKVSSDYYGATLAYGDMMVSVAKLTEHTAPHTVKKIGDFIVWSEEPAYTYVNNATSSYINLIVENGLGISYDSQGTNQLFLQFSNATQQDISTWKKVVNYFAGIANGSARYAGTYNYVIHSGLIPSKEEYIGAQQNKNNVAFVNELSINLNKGVLNTNISDDIEPGSLLDESCGRIKTSRLNKTHANLVALVGEKIILGVAVAAIVLVGVATGSVVILLAGVLAGMASTAIVYYDTYAVFNGWNMDSTTPLYNAINNLDFTFD